MKIDNTRNFYPNFSAGLTKSMHQEILACSPQKISEHLLNNGIYSDFKGNKVIAWCSLKCIEIIQNINKKFHTNFALPRSIIVEDFNRLNLDNTATGATNMAPAMLYKGSKKIIPEKVVFFNEFRELNSNNYNYHWDNINEISDVNFETQIAPTDFFLDTFLHEFGHVAHADNMVKRLSGEKYINVLVRFLNANLSRFKEHQSYFVKNICKYASENPLETIACDLSKRFTNAINKNNFTIENNVVKCSPYSKNFRIVGENADQLIHDIWEGII